MATAAEDRNRAFVLEAFDTLFNRRDYAAAQRFWSPDYIQHSAHIAPGREGLFELVKAAPPECVTKAGWSWRAATMSCCTGGSATSASPPIG